MEALEKDVHLNIRGCTLEDVEILSKVGSEAYKDHYMHIWAQNKNFYIDLSFSVEAITRDMEAGNIDYFLISLKEEPIGLIKINVDKALKQYPATEAMEIEKIYLKNEAVGYGIGSKAIDYIIQFAKKKNKKVLWLNVMTTSKAFHFYQKLGFEAVGIYNLEYKDLKPEYREMLIMKMLL